ncbi:tyrosine-type recombinase/integrase [Marinobacter alexandrii]|uniref:tyrosine-type recombinase/integrase n=1 Tax=Marinobacter alexandrii TaxID=2570351 RepID=UPI001FFFF420|nr:tyrosine-type recombinase/integrase [Marinobacter alexandrii]MCK2149543.1 tyrosine-type recombinase/integrase [Marinobacter alexandrii]
MKRSQIKRRPLADTVLERLEPEAAEYREYDSDGLYFRVKPNGSKSWNLRYKRPSGKWAWKGLGRFPQVSGRAAREKADELLKIASNGEDLATHGKEEVPAVLFKEAAEDWYSRKVAEGLAEKTLRLMRDTLDNDVLPEIGETAAAEVTRADCTQAIEKIEDRGAWEVAKKARGWISNIFSLAIAQGRCELNPASELSHVARKAPATKHHPHLLEAELPAFLKALSRSNSLYTTRAAVYMVLLTASRPGMVRYAEWSEVDLDKALWLVPAGKMKKGRDHLVPLPSQLIPTLKSLEEMTGLGQYLFPGARKNPVISHTTINAALSQIGYKGKLVGHGARHTASTLLNEHGWRDSYVDMQLSHKMGGIRGVYNKAKYLEQRRQMMQWYADYLDALQQGITVAQKEQFKSRVIG